MPGRLLIEHNGPCLEVDGRRPLARKTALAFRGGYLPEASMRENSSPVRSL